MRNRKLMLNILLSFCTFVVLMSVVQYKYVYASEIKTYRFEDLHEEVLFPGDRIYVYKDYHGGSGAGNGYTNTIKFWYYQSPNKDEYASKCEEVNSLRNYTIKRYSDLFDNGEEYTSWDISISGASVILRPSNKEARDDKVIPSDKNNYSLKDDSDNDFYLAHSLEDSVKLYDKWTKNDRGEYFFLNEGDYTVDDNVKMEILFNATKNQSLYFDIRVALGYLTEGKANSFTAYFNDEQIEGIPNISSEWCGVNDECFYYYRSYIYEPVLLEIKETGLQKLTFEYKITNPNSVKINKSSTYNFAYIKNINLLTYINSGDKLLTADLVEGDKFVYLNNEGSSSISDTYTYGSSDVDKNYACYRCNSKLVWTNIPDDNCQIDKDVTSKGMCTDNPKTVSSKNVLIVMGLVFVFMLLLALHNHKNKVLKIKEK